MRIVLVSDTFPPLRTSGAVQLRDLARSLVLQGHAVTVMLPSSEIQEPWILESVDEVSVLRLRAPRIKDISYVRRTLGEFLMSFAMRRNLRRSPLREAKWDGVVWYSPSIFHGPFAKSLKKSSGCRGYLVVRDIFPEWAVDMGLMRRGLPYLFFRAVASYQHAVADVIGVQAPGNLAYFRRWAQKSTRKLEVLQNWLGPAANRPCSIQIDQTGLAGRAIFVYAGNMGVAQGMDILIQLAERMQTRKDVGFLFVGRGSEACRLAREAQVRALTNTLFADEIHPDEIPGLYAQCHVGLVALDPRHRSHNIPGKFLTYMQCGLPVLANVNRGNDLAELIRHADVGRVSEENSVEALHVFAQELADRVARDEGVAQRCQNLFHRLFSAEAIARQIVDGLAQPGVLSTSERLRRLIA